MHREIKRAALGVFSAVASLTVVGLVIFTQAVLPNLRQASTLKLIRDLQEAAGEYHSDYGSLPDRERDLVAALVGANAESKTYLPETATEKLVNGLIHDSYGTALKHLPGDPLPRFISAGPDRASGTEDDLSDDTLAEIFRRYPMFQKEEKPPLPGLMGKPHPSR